MKGKRPPGVSQESDTMTIERNIDDLELNDLPDTETTEVIDMTEKPVEDNNVEIDFENDDFSEEFVKGKTVDSQASETSEKGKLTADEVRDQIKTFEEEKSRTQTFADYQNQAKFFLNFFDILWSNLMKFFAKDTSSKAYQLPVSDLNRLIDPLAMVLAKYASRFAVEWIFIIGLTSAYSGSFIKAKNRRDIITGKKKPPPEDEPEESFHESKAKKETITDSVEKPKKKWKSYYKKRTEGNPTK